MRADDRLLASPAQPGALGAKLTRRTEIGKLSQVAPQQAREGEHGVRVIFENSTVC